MSILNPGQPRITQITRRKKEKILDYALFSQFLQLLCSGSVHESVSSSHLLPFSHVPKSSSLRFPFLSSQALFVFLSRFSFLSSLLLTFAQKQKDMVKSMTGYGKAECEFSHKKVTIEIKSLNSKQLDLNTRISLLFREKDLEIRRELSDKLVRGKVDFILYTESLGDESATKINAGIVKSYYKQMEEITADLNIPCTTASYKQFSPYRKSLKMNGKNSTIRNGNPFL